MSEEIIEEKSLFEMLVEKVANTEAPVAVFLVVFLVLAILLCIGKIDQALFEKLILSDGLISAIIKLVKK